MESLSKIRIDVCVCLEYTRLPISGRVLLTTAGLSEQLQCSVQAQGGGCDAGATQAGTAAEHGRVFQRPHRLCAQIHQT